MRTKRERNLVVSGGITVVLLLLWNFMVPSGSGAARQLLPASAAREKNAVALRTTRRLAAENAAMNAQIADTAYTDAPDRVVPQLVQKVQHIANQAGVHINEIKPMRPQTLQSGKTLAVPVELRARAAFQPNVVKFLYLAEDPGGKMAVTHVQINPPDSKTHTVDVTVDIAACTTAIPSASSGGIPNG
ncbi:MAG: hypothetical protein KGJ62_07455 [Armatimonadetes bacterium]|nr:hypothetical protein [Armatimonadota bacterium]MDE2207039.1 hypothetical protein [Armatimonadota bacterium]